MGTRILNIIEYKYMTNTSTAFIPSTDQVDLTQGHLISEPSGTYATDLTNLKKPNESYGP